MSLYRANERKRSRVEAGRQAGGRVRRGGLCQALAPMPEAPYLVSLSLIMSAAAFAEALARNSAATVWDLMN